MANYVIDDGQNKIPGYSQDETDAAIVAGIAANLNAENIPVAEGSSNMISDYICYKVGDEISLTNAIYCGYTSNLSQRVQFFIPLSKIMKATINDVEVVGDFTIYSQNQSESIINSSTVGSWTFARKDNGVYLRYDLNSTLASPNRSVVAVLFGTGSKLIFKNTPT
jgi:hypothetical protein